MEPGFLVDNAHYSCDVQQWVAGKPVKGLLSPLKGPLIGYDVITFRCPKCGLLESHVPEVRTRPRSRAR